MHTCDIMDTDDSHPEYRNETGKEPAINEDILRHIGLLGSLQETFECQRCGECCKQEYIAFTEKDLLMASDKKDLSPSEFVEKYHLSLIKSPGDMEFYRLTVGNAGICPFCFDHECSIYEARPQVCRGFPFLTPENVQNAFKMNNIIKLGRNCNTAIAQIETAFGHASEHQDEN